MPIIFSDLISIDKSWFDNEFNHHYTQNINEKLKVRLYTVKPSGTVINCNSLANALLDILPDYFKSDIETEKEIQRELRKSTSSDRKTIEKKVYSRTYREAAKFFKTKSSDSKSGKYGELLLFGVTEAVLNCKMIAYKITNLTNYHDEIKGGDGIFMGVYELMDGSKRDAYLIGESKVWQNYSGAKKDALDSINRFYDPKIQATFNSMEFFVAQKDVAKILDIQNTDIDELYDRINPNTELFKKQISVHPILIMYDTKGYDGLMTKASDNNELVELIEKNVQSNLKRTLENISKKVKEYPELEKIYLDFILIPVNSVESFNQAMDNLI